LSPAQLDAGALAVTWQSTIPLTQWGPGLYDAELMTGNQTLLWGGNPYVVAAAGGSAVGPFSVTDETVSGTVQFSNLTYGQNVPRTSDLDIEWTGGNPALQSQVTIGGFSAAGADFTPIAFFECVAPLSAGKFTIPRWILSGLPPSATISEGSYSYPLGWIWIGQYDQPTSFTAKGLDAGIITDLFSSGVGLYFQ